VVAGGCAIWVWPMVFVATMLADFAPATLDLRVPFVEPAIWSAIITVGLFVALAVNAMAGRIVVVGPLPGGAAGAH